MAAAVFLSPAAGASSSCSARRHLIWLAARTAFEIIINAGEEALSRVINLQHHSERRSHFIRWNYLNKCATPTQTQHTKEHLSQQQLQSLFFKTHVRFVLYVHKLQCIISLNGILFPAALHQLFAPARGQWQVVPAWIYYIPPRRLEKATATGNIYEVLI